MSKKITILGSGGTALAAAATLTWSGHTVTLADFAEYAGQFSIIEEKGGILLRGNGLRGQVLPAAITTDVTAAVQSAEIVIVSAVATRHEEIAAAIAPAVRGDQVVVIVPGNAGSLVFHRVFQAAGVTDAPILLEIQGNLFPNRITGPAEVVSGGKLRKKRAAAFPGKQTQAAIEKLSGVLELEPARNVFETTLNTPNVINHLASSVLNAAQIDKKGEAFHLFLDGLTPSVFTALDAAYAELHAVLTALGWFTQPNPTDHLRLAAEYDAHPELDVFRSLAGPASLKHRYVAEDAPCGVALLASLAKNQGIPVPFTQALLTIVSALNGTDYYGEGRTLEQFGLADLSIAEIEQYLETGER